MSLPLTVGLVVAEIHLAEPRSLKEKRMVLARVKGRIRSRFQIAVAEVEHQDLWQRATLAAVTVASSRDVVEQTLAAVEEEIERQLPGEVVRVAHEFLLQD